MKQLILTGLGNEVDLNTGKTVFTAIFNGTIRIEISKEAAQVLTSHIYASGPARAQVASPPERMDFEEDEPSQNGESAMIIEDTPASVYDDDTGIEQV